MPSQPTEIIRRALESLKIVALCIAAAVVYGISHDQVTARVCVEYFTIAHPPVFHTESPTLLALGWGVIATWWVGAILSVLAVPAAQLGSWPSFDARQLLRPLAVLLSVMGCSSLVAGAVGYYLEASGKLPLDSYWSQAIPAARHARFMADVFAHLAAYGVGFVGGLVVCCYIVTWRWYRNAKVAIAARLTVAS